MLAGASALVWGIADFCGGKAVQEGEPSHRQALSVTVLSQLCAVPMIALLLVLAPGHPGVSALGLGAVAGIADLFGIVLLYRALSSGHMAVVAPTTAVTAAVVPLTGGLLLGERPGPAALTGVAIAIVAILLLTMGSMRKGPLTLGPLWIALASGALFGLYFIFLKYAAADAGAGLWPLAAARASAIPLGLTIMIFLPVGAKLLPSREVWRFTIFAGLLDTLANGFYLLAAQDGAVSVVAPVASLYPATTVILALLVNKERLRSVQMVGLGLAAASLVLAAS
ncbi:EamA family transporter [Catelliglobosispora koreensis]|uniref:EamA family transporter n=1 Tax=Catelliglobosispora koreensis TaxID=129052 RepID=UPI000366BF4E|nr:EamA family transporter [Catelliglobosispora koreensis]